MGVWGCEWGDLGGHSGCDVCNRYFSFVKYKGGVLIKQWTK